MKRTKTLRLQQPEPGDEYNHNTLSSNVNLIDKMMANIGGNVAKRTVPLSNVFTMREGFTLNGGSFTVYGNGLAWIELNFTANKKYNVVNITGLIEGATVADVNPEFATVISSTLTSGGIGPAVSGYIAPNTTRVVLRLTGGYFPDGIPSGQVLQLSGFYPLVEVPKSIGLSQMRSAIFDYEVHNQNLLKIDSVASRLKTNLDQFDAPTSALATAGGSKIVSRVLHLNTNGLVTMYIRVSNVTLPTSNGGDITNTQVATITNTNWRPDRYVKVVSAGDGPLVQGEINPTTGAISITSYAGKNSTISKSTEIALVADWPYNGS